MQRRYTKWLFIMAEKSAKLERRLLANLLVKVQKVKPEPHWRTIKLNVIDNDKDLGMSIKCSFLIAYCGG